MNLPCDKRYYLPLCPYLAVGNGHVLIHLDAYGVPNSLQWPEVGSPDRLGWRDPFDEWPYWQELDQKCINAKMPYVIDTRGEIHYFHDAWQKKIEYLKDTNILTGTYVFGDDCRVTLTTFVCGDRDVWVREYQTQGVRQLILQGEFCEKAVRGNPLSNTGRVDYKGAFIGGVEGVYNIVCDTSFEQSCGKFIFDCHNMPDFSLYFCMARDILAVQNLANYVLRMESGDLKEQTAAKDREWISRTRTPQSRHPLIVNCYRRWLLSNKLCVHKDGAVSAGPRPFWSFSWPRDSAAIAASFAVAGYQEIAEGILSWHLENTPESGIHDARYSNIDRRPVTLDNRDLQTDSPGWLLWSTALVALHADSDTFLHKNIDAIFKLADTLTEFRDPETGLLCAGADYWESIPAQSIGSSAIGLAGLLAASKIAEKFKNHSLVDKYTQAYQGLLNAIETHLWDGQKMVMRRSINPLNESLDIASAFIIYPAKAWKGNDARAKAVLQNIFDNLWDFQSGGVKVAPGTEVDSLWYFLLGVLLLGVSNAGCEEMTQKILDRTFANVSSQGFIPEQIYTKTGNLGGCAYLCASQAFFLLYGFDGKSSLL